MPWPWFQSTTDLLLKWRERFLSCEWRGHRLVSEFAKVLEKGRGGGVQQGLVARSLKLRRVRCLRCDLTDPARPDWTVLGEAVLVSYTMDVRQAIDLETDGQVVIDLWERPFKGEPGGPFRRAGASEAGGGTSEGGRTPVGLPTTDCGAPDAPSSV